MPKFIKDGALVDNNWAVLTVEQTSEAVPAGQVLVPLATWLAQRDTLSARAAAGELGVWLQSDETGEALVDSLEQLAVIAVNFPVFADGRGFTTGRELRERYRFQGELRAIGGFMRDQLFYLKRCGFNAFALEQDDAALEDALTSLNDFSDSYQPAIDQPLPLFRRRA